MNHPPKPPASGGNFIAMLQGKTGGVTLPKLDSRLAELVEKVQETGKAGTLTYKLKIVPNAKRGVRLLDNVQTKLPEEEEGVSFFWIGQGGALLRNDPNQTELPLRILPEEGPAAPLKTAAHS